MSRQPGCCQQGGSQRVLNPRLKLLADPFLIPNMEAAIERLWKARSNNERLLIYGDYDVDASAPPPAGGGADRLGWNAQPYLPGRFDDGQGSACSLEKCLDQFDVDVVLAVDCGSTAVEAIDFLNEKIDVLVLDHHQVSVPPPNPVAMVNPQLSDDYPNFQELCSVGSPSSSPMPSSSAGEWKGLQNERDLDLKHTDLVALGTVADLVPLTAKQNSSAPGSTNSVKPHDRDLSH